MLKTLTCISVYVLAHFFELSSLSILVVAPDASFGPPFRQWCQIFVPLLKKKSIGYSLKVLNDIDIYKIYWLKIFETATQIILVLVT